jgi:hypothetical protein
MIFMDNTMPVMVSTVDCRVLISLCVCARVCCVCALNFHRMLSFLVWSFSP